LYVSEGRTAGIEAFTKMLKDSVVIRANMAVDDLLSNNMMKKLEQLKELGERELNEAARDVHQVLDGAKLGRLLRSRPS
jgi:hypothetical protein